MSKIKVACYFLGHGVYYCCSSFCCWGDQFTKAQGSVVSSRIGMILGRIVLHVSLNKHLLTESDFRYNVILSRWPPWRHDVRPLLTAICSSVCRLPASSPSACDVIGLLYALQVLIHSRFVLVLLMDYVTVKSSDNNAGLAIPGNFSCLRSMSWGHAASMGWRHVDLSKAHFLAVARPKLSGRRSYSTVLNQACAPVYRFCIECRPEELGNGLDWCRHD